VGRSSLVLPFEIMKAVKLLLSVAMSGAVSACAFAQFDGPTPLAWRWSPPAVEYSPDGAPLVANNTVYVAAKNRIFALDAHSGNEKWKFPLDGAQGTFRVQPVTTNKTIIDSTDAGYIYAANAADGTLKWTYQVQQYAVLGQPAAVGNLVLYKKSDNTLNALALDTGKPAWPAPLPIPTGFDGPLLVHGDDVIFADNDNQVYSVNSVTQKVNWKRQFGFLPHDLSPSLFGDNIYMYSGQYLVCLNVIRGYAKWQVNLGQDMEYGPAVSADGMMCATQDGNLFFFDLNGHRANREVVNLGSGPAAQPAAVGSKYLVPTNNGALNLIDPKAGQTLWIYTVRPTVPVAQKAGDAPIFNGKDLIDPRVLTVPAAGPAVLNGTTLLVMCTDASLLAFDPKMGVDLTPPDVDMLYPKPGSLISGTPPMDIVFKVNDEASGVNLNTLKIDVDGKPLDYIVGHDGVAWIHLAMDGKIKSLDDGRRTFTVAASDWMGNETKKTFSVTIDNSLPPLGAPKGLKPGDQGKGGKGGKGGGGGCAGAGIG